MTTRTARGRGGGNSSNPTPSRGVPPELTTEDRLGKVENLMRIQAGRIVALENSNTKMEEKMEDMEEQLKKYRRVTKSLQGTLEENTAVSGAHANIPSSNLKFRDDEGNELVWFETTNLLNGSEKAKKGKAQKKCYSCGKLTSYVCKGCSTTTKMVWVCRVLTEHQHANLIANRKKDQTHRGEGHWTINHCWEYHLADPCYKRKERVEEISSDDENDEIDDDEEEE